MHGYGVNQELARREVRDWAGVSRPQVYYSLRKLADAGHIGPAPGRAAGAERGPAEPGPPNGDPPRAGRNAASTA
jgi:hypothetical protein